MLRILGPKFEKRFLGLQPAFGFVETSREVVGVESRIGASDFRLQQRGSGYAEKQRERNKTGRVRRIPSAHVSLLRLRRRIEKCSPVVFRSRISIHVTCRDSFQVAGGDDGANVTRRESSP